jgi:multidrug resistance efflux pump
MAHEQQRLVSAQSAVRETEARFLRADTDLERLKPLAVRKAVPQRDLGMATADQVSAAAAVENAQATLKTTTVGDRLGIEQAQANLTAARATLDKAKLDRDETMLVN